MAKIIILVTSVSILIQPVCVTKDLGVHVCSVLSFTTNLNTIAAKVHVRACLIHKCITCVLTQSHLLTRAFVAYVRPILEYPSVIWSPYQSDEPWCQLKHRSELFYLSFYVPCYILSSVRIGFY